MKLTPWRPLRPLFLSLAVCLALAAPRPALAAPRLDVFVSIGPQKYIVEHIGAGLVEVTALVADGQNPHTFEPTPKQIARLSRARIYFGVGVDFERVWLPKIASANPSLLIAHMEEGIEKLAMSADHHEGEEDHHEGEKGETEASKRLVKDHEEGLKDPHIWLSPPLCIQMAENASRALKAALPGESARLDAALAAFSARMNALDQRIREMLSPLKQRKFMVFHPSWGYFAQRYNLIQIPIEVEGKEPGSRSLARMINAARSQQIRVIFVQKGFSDRSAQVVAQAIGGRVVALDPLAEDYAANLERTARAFVEAKSE